VFIAIDGDFHGFHLLVAHHLHSVHLMQWASAIYVRPLKGLVDDQAMAIPMNNQGRLSPFGSLFIHQENAIA
jgi:hypothetical protein